MGRRVGTSGPTTSPKTAPMPGAVPYPDGERPISSAWRSRSGRNCAATRAGRVGVSSPFGAPHARRRARAWPRRSGERPYCGLTTLSKLGENVTVISRRWKVIETAREKFACGAGETFEQPSAPIPCHA